MPLFLSQFSYTPEALSNMIKKPEDRASKVDDHLKQIGGRLISFYYCQGDYHGLAIYEAPSGAAAFANNLAVESSGYIKAAKTTEIFSADEGLEVFKRAAGQSIHRPPEVK